MVGDGFGGRLWYQPTNYTVGSYSAYSVCSNCDNENGQLYGWGSNNYNQLGLGLTVSGVTLPQAIPNMMNVKYYSTGYIMGAIKYDGTGWTWGYSPMTSTGITSTPVQVINDAYFIDASSTTISFVKNDGTVWSIGDNNYNNFGNSSAPSTSLTPIQMEGVFNAVRVANNFFGTIVLLADSTLLSVGDDLYNTGFLGQGNNYSIQSAIPISTLSNVVDVKANSMGVTALNADGDVYYWGASDVNLISAYNSPHKIDALHDIIAISACDDGYHTMALDKDGNVYTWGDNSMMQTGSLTPYHIPVDSPELVAVNAIDIMAGETFSYIVKEDGSLWGVGFSNGGSIWLNLTNESRVEFTQMDPSIIPGLCDVWNINVTASECSDTTTSSILIEHVGGEEPYEYSIDEINFQSSNLFSTIIPGTYIATVVDANGCSISQEIVLGGINCVPESPKQNINFPNVFTPNNDLNNDVFNLSSSNLTEFKCSIYNRWGILITEFTELELGWDGTSQEGLPCSQGTYFYVVDFKTSESDEWKHHQDFLNLVRD